MGMWEEEDPVELKRAAARGDLYAQRKLAEFRSNTEVKQGKIHRKSRIKISKKLRQQLPALRDSAEHGDAESQYILAKAYHGGSDITYAVKLYTKAAEQNHSGALDALQRMAQLIYYPGALEALRSLAEKGHAGAINALRQLAAKGHIGAMETLQKLKTNFSWPR